MKMMELTPADLRIAARAARLWPSTYPCMSMRECDNGTEYMCPAFSITPVGSDDINPAVFALDAVWQREKPRGCAFTIAIDQGRGEEVSLAFEHEAERIEAIWRRTSPVESGAFCE